VRLSRWALPSLALLLGIASFALLGHAVGAWPFPGLPVVDPLRMESLDMRMRSHAAALGLLAVLPGALARGGRWRVGLRLLGLAACVVGIHALLLPQSWQVHALVPGGGGARVPVATERGLEQRAWMTTVIPAIAPVAAVRHVRASETALAAVAQGMHLSAAGGPLRDPHARSRTRLWAVRAGVLRAVLALRVALLPLLGLAAIALPLGGRVPRPIGAGLRIALAVVLLAIPAGNGLLLAACAAAGLPDDAAVLGRTWISTLALGASGICAWFAGRCLAGGLHRG